MPRFIEEFYYGNIDPQARSTKENKTVQKQMEILMKNEDLLTNALTDKPKKWFLDYVNAWGVVNGESNLDSFIMGFRLGANFAYEALFRHIGDIKIAITKDSCLIKDYIFLRVCVCK